MEHHRPSPSRVALVALASTLAAFALRAAYVAAGAPHQDTPGLARKYQACADHLLAGDGFFLQAGAAPVPYVDRLPGYVALLALVMAVAGTSTLALLLAHAAIGSIQAGVASIAGARLGGLRGAVVAGALVAAWPPLWKSDVQLVETGACGAVMTALVAVALGAGPRSPAVRAVLLSLLSLAIVLLRPDAMLVPLLVAAWQLLETGRTRPARRPWGAVALTLALPALACGAWAARNARVADGAFVSLGLGTNLLAAVGESVATEDASFGDQAVAQSEGYSGLYWPEPARRDRERVHRALAIIRAHPAGYAKGCVRRVAVLLSLHPGRLWPGPSAEDEIRAWRAAHPGRARYDGLFRAAGAYVASHPARALLTFAWTPLALGLAALGAWRLRRRPRTLAVLLALPLYEVAIHVPIHAEPRYVYPVLPVLLVLGTCGMMRALRPTSDPVAPAIAGAP